jgi:malonyl-CoA decarboxylase
VEVLSQEFPRLKVFCTLSPVPGFVSWLGGLLREGDFAGPMPARRALTAVIERVGADISKFAGDPNCVARLAALKEPLLRLCAAYLLQPAAVAETAQDQVAKFHLNNGARLERINWLADTSRKGLRESLGLMVNYLYEPGAIESNHEKFVRGEIVASRRVRGMVRPD